MFKEIENELLSILNDEPIEKIAHMPTKEIAKTMELLYKIKFQDIQRVYTEPTSDYIRMTIIYDADKSKISNDVCPINGKVYHITFIPSSLLNKDETNAIQLSRMVVTYTSYRLLLIMDKYKNLIESKNDSLLYYTYLQVVPVIACAILRRVYSGPTLPKLIYMSLIETMDIYKKLYTEEGIETILELFNEGLGVSELLDNGFICSIRPDDSKYPGIWCGINTERSV